MNRRKIEGDRVVVMHQLVALGLSFPGLATKNIKYRTLSHIILTPDIRNISKFLYYNSYVCFREGSATSTCKQVGVSIEYVHNLKLLYANIFDISLEMIVLDF